MNNKIVFAIAAAVSVFAACSKSDGPTQPPVADPKGFTIDLQSSAVSMPNIDSADVIFRLVGSSTRVQERLVKKDNKLIASTKTLTPGTWNADVEIYTKTVNQLSQQYVLIKAILIADQPQDISIAGPSATNGNGWIKRNVKSSANGQVVILVPEDVYDSWFEFRSKTAAKLLLGVQREAINVNYVVDEKSWSCASNCPMTEGRLNNNAHFMSFTANIMTSPWTRNSISMAVINEKQEVLLEYDRDWIK
ncbi:hypothetical protein [Paraflavitalea pollutisoli]|uniref:hypothetical protein n=1 Tax=Paraflavitalea pollutisoli TaxID=3034143 RepID=UPI0023EAC6AD|nr:hypothetical protein [Paraflavitalea sp. H1-2-19X]